MSKNNLIIITTTLNEEKEIFLHIDYLNELADKYGIKYVIIDGGSKDKTLQIIESKDTLGNIFKSTNCSIYKAWNIGIDYASNNTYICFLGVGDRLSELYIEGLYSNIDRYRYDVLFTHLDTNKKQKLTSDVNSSLMHWTRLPFPHAGAFFRKDLFEKNGKFNEEFKIAGDLEWLLRLNYYARVGKNNIKYKYIEKGSVYMRPGGISTGKGKYLSILISETVRAHFLYKTPISIKRILYFVIMYFRSFLLCRR